MYNNVVQQSQQLRRLQYYTKVLNAFYPWDCTSIVSYHICTHSVISYYHLQHHVWLNQFGMASRYPQMRIFDEQTGKQSCYELPHNTSITSNTQ